MANNDNQDDNADLMKDLPDDELEDLEKTLSDADGNNSGKGAADDENE